MMITDIISSEECKLYPVTSDKIELRMVYGLKEADNLVFLRHKYLENHLLTESSIEEDRKLDEESIHVLYQMNNIIIGGIRFTDLELKSCPVRKLGVLDKFNINLNSNACEAGRFFLKLEYRSKSLKLLRMTSKLIKESNKYEYYIAICHDHFVPLYNRLTTINLANNFSLPGRDKNYNLILGEFGE